MLFNNLKSETKTILSLLVLGMLIGCSTHIHWVLRYGFMAEEYNAPLFSMIFWDSLTFLDPLAAFLLLFRPKTGLYLTLLIISFDILHNLLVFSDKMIRNFTGLWPWICDYWMVLCQIGFGLFVWLSFRKVLKSLKDLS